jgi:pilus assembly protein CpaE
VCVLGPKGGSGKTLTTSNLAVALAEAGQSVAIVDLDLQFGDVALCLGLGPERTFYDLALAGGTLDAQKLDAYMMSHSSGVRVLLAPTRPDQASSISVELIRDVYSCLRANYDAVIVDTPPGFTAEVIATIDGASDLIVVGMLDALSLKNTKLGLETLELMGCEPGMIRMVLNPESGRNQPE